MMQSAFWVPPGSYPSTQALDHDAGDCPAPLTRLYAIAAAALGAACHRIEMLIMRRGFAISESKYASDVTSERPRRCPDDSEPEFPTPTARSECGAAAALSALAARGSRTTFIEYAYRRRLLHSLGAAPFTDRGTRIAHTRSRTHHPYARRRGHAKCRRRARRSTSCRGCAASS